MKNENEGVGVLQKAAKTCVALLLGPYSESVHFAETGQRGRSWRHSRPSLVVFLLIVNDGGRTAAFSTLRINAGDPILPHCGHNFGCGGAGPKHGPFQDELLRGGNSGWQWKMQRDSDGEGNTEWKSLDSRKNGNRYQLPKLTSPNGKQLWLAPLVMFSLVGGLLGEMAPLMSAAAVSPVPTTMESPVSRNSALDDVSMTVSVASDSADDLASDRLVKAMMEQRPSSQHRSQDAPQSPSQPTTTTMEVVPLTKLKYWTIMADGSLDLKRDANEALIDHAVGTINTMFYDNSGGAYFTPRDMYDRWKAFRAFSREGPSGIDRLKKAGKLSLGGSRSSLSSSLLLESMPRKAFDTRENVVQGIKWLVGTLDDPFSAYLTREELRDELQRRDDGFLGIGAIVEPPQRASQPALHLRPYLDTGKLGSTASSTPSSSSTESSAVAKSGPLPSVVSLQDLKKLGKAKSRASSAESDLSTSILTETRVANLPVVTAVEPDSPAERAGIVVGDRIVAVGTDKFLGLGRDEVTSKLSSRYRAENYGGYPTLSIAKPIIRQVLADDNDSDGTSSTSASDRDPTAPRATSSPQEFVVGYRTSRLKLPTSTVTPFQPYMPSLNQFSNGATNSASSSIPSGSSVVSGGDAIVHYEILTPLDSIFRSSESEESNSPSSSFGSVGYIRLTRFSRASTAGYLQAVKELEAAGATSYIIDVRNNYGGVIQEAMLTAATLLRDPHTVLCYTMNSRGGFTPHDAEEYIIDTRYPGYLLSSEAPSVTLEQVRREDPEFADEDGIMWVPPSSYASLHEQGVKRGLRHSSADRVRPSRDLGEKKSNKKMSADAQKRVEIAQLRAQKPIVMLMNEGTASSAEVFASALHDNGRTVALVGAKTYGKGLIQHTFPMPDGGGLRLTVAEYLTPALKHVTQVGSARFDPFTGDYIGGGLTPDIRCDSSQGIPSNVGADICVGVALDALENAEIPQNAAGSNSDDGTFVERRGGVGGGSGRRNPVKAGIVKDDF